MKLLKYLLKERFNLIDFIILLITQIILLHHFNILF